MRAVVVVVLLAGAAAAAATTKNECHSGDRAALLAVKAAFRSASYFQSWTAEFPCCKWIGVYCDASSSPTTMRRVVTLALLRDDNVTGALPGAAIARLTALQELLLLHVPGLSGPIPPAIAKLSQLSMLTISYTGMSGPVPSFLSQLTALTYLRLSFNSLTGGIPASLADLPNLSFIDLGRNHLTGPIPPLLLCNMSLGQSAYLCLSHNNLSGTIPAEFAAVKFWSLDLSRNAFTGDASGLFGLAKPLENLNLSRNAFSFNLSGVELPEQLGILDVSHNAIYGVLPPQVANLELLNVSYNRLCGTVPSGGNMDRFDQYCFQHNKGLCGTPLSPCK